MTKNMMKIAMVAALVAGGLSAAHAANDVTVTMTGEIDTVSCNVSADGSASVKDVLLGNYKPSDFAVGTGAFQGVYTAGTEKKFSVKLSDCAAEAGTAAGTLNLRVSGNTVLASSSDLFNTEGGATAGATLRTWGADGNTASGTLLKDQDLVAMKVVADPTTDLAGTSTMVFGTQMASVGATPAAQQVTAPVTFTVAYN
ncbi:TPA: fimbrial protein [Serratia liquefaciens]